MKTILSAALVLGLCGLAGAQDEKADPVGTWKCEYEIGDQKRMSTLTIKKDGDKLAGTMSWPDQKEAKLKDVKLKDGELTFSAEREIMDNKLTIEYKLTIDGDKLKGKGAVDVRGREAGVRHRGEAGEEVRRRDQFGGAGRNACPTRNQTRRHFAFLNSNMKPSLPSKFLGRLPFSIE